MRKYFHINLNDKTIDTQEMNGEEVVKAGRYFIVKTLLERETATLDPLAPESPLIFSAGPFAGTNFSNGNRTSVGCKSPLTGGIKEANGGGTFSYALGQQNIAGFILNGASDDWVVIHFPKEGDIKFESAEPYLGKGNFEVAEMLHEKYGKKVSLGICGPVGEYQGLLAGISFSDIDRRPSRLAARGGVGAVMGSKKVKAIVVDMARMPELHERKKVLADVKEYSKLLRDDPAIMDVYNAIGTMAMADYTNHIGGLPTLNFSTGQQVDTDQAVFKMGGDFISNLNTSRGGQHTHACMPGCVIQCSNVYVDENGKEISSPIEYETLSLLGTNCGIAEPDDLAYLNHIANELGVDTIETGATLAVLMEAGLAKFGDVDFMKNAMNEMWQGTDNGKIWAQGTARVGEHYGVERVPVIKKQAISAYDPRVIEVTGLSMMISAQGADHTTGNVPRYLSRDKDLDTLMAASLEAQITSAATDSLGLCIFGRSVTNVQLDFITSAINNAHGTNFDASFFIDLGKETLKLEQEFNKAAGFTAADDELPKFFYKEGIFPTEQTARFHGEEVHETYDRLTA